MKTSMPTAKPQSDLAGLSEINPRGFLSFGTDSPPIALTNLNVMIGLNGSGKSNLIEALCFLRSSPLKPSGLEAYTRAGGGVREWIWKGDKNQTAEVSAVARYPHGNSSLRHVVKFESQSQAFRLVDERIENEHKVYGKTEPYFYYKYQNGRPVINVRDVERELRRETVDLDASILSQRQDPDEYPEITYLASQYQKIRTYREWSFGRTTLLRQPQKADMRSDILEEDFSNLGLFLNRLRRIPTAKRRIQDELRKVCDGVVDFDVSVEGGTVQVFFEESNGFTIPATRLSDGTLRYLCLLAILCDPSPPPLLCIEEPELGLHPDVIPGLADLLVEASSKTQIIATTHSDILVDALTHMPDSVLVCEKHDGKSNIERLDRSNLSKWLDNYRLGQLWLQGELGGTR